MRTLSFDLDGTLVIPRFINLVWDYGIPNLYAKKNEIDFEAAKALVTKEYQIIGEERIEWYDIKYWFRYFDLDESWEALLYEFKDEIDVYPEVPQVLERLSKIYNLVITSNATREFIDVEMEVSGLRSYFGRIFSATSDFKLVKKTPEFYLAVCDILKVEPKELVHIGDHWDFDYLTPKSLGINAFYVDREGRRGGDSVIGNLMELEEKLKRG